MKLGLGLYRRCSRRSTSASRPPVRGTPSSPTWLITSPRRSSFPPAAAARCGAAPPRTPALVAGGAARPAGRDRSRRIDPGRLREPGAGLLVRHPAGRPAPAEQIEGLKTLIRRMGAAGIRCWATTSALAGVWGRSDRPSGRGGAAAPGVTPPAGRTDPDPAGVVWNMIYDPDAPPGSVGEISTSSSGRA